MRPILKIVSAAALALAALVGAAAQAAGQTPGPAAGPGAGASQAAAILAALDSNESFKAIRYSGRMEITLGGQVRVKTMEAVAIAGPAGAGSDKAFIEFTNPEDRGVRYLKLGKDLWMWFPKEQDTVKISGHLLKEGMMGSDVSYEDALESSDWNARYAASVKGEDSVDGRAAWILELSAKVPTAAYDRILLWVDKERSVRVREEMYAKSGKLLKTSVSLDFKRIGGRWFATRTELVSALRKDSKTVFAMDKVEIDPVLDARQFTMAALTK